MSFKDFIQKNKKKLEHQDDLSLVWEAMEDKLPTAHSKKSKLGFNKSYWLLVASILLILGFFFLSKEENALAHNSGFVSLKDKASVEKIHFIKTAAFDDNHKAEIISTLLDIVENDESKNVKLTALRALEKYIDNEKVKIGLINLLTNEKEPYLTIAVLNILKRGKVKESLPAFDEIIQDNSQVKFVQEEAIKGQAFLKNI